MSFASGYLAQLATFAQRSPLPRVKKLHLPPPSTHTDENKGEFCAIELEDGAIGLSFILLDETLPQLRQIQGNLDLTGADTLALAQEYQVGAGIRKTIGFAAANAITRCLFNRAGFIPQESQDSIGGVDPQPGDLIGMIGLFKPLISRVVERGARLTVVELNSDLVGTHDQYVVTLDPCALTICNKVVSTSTLLLNDTLDRMLFACRNSNWFAMIGPSAGCLPDFLFQRGITLLGGSWVTNVSDFTSALVAGEPTSSSARKYAMTPDSYPGFDTLLERLN